MADGIDLTTDVDALTATKVQAMQSLELGWQANTASLGYRLLRADAYGDAEVIDQFLDFTDRVFRALGAKVNVQEILATPAVGTATFTIRDTDGAVILAGYEFSLTADDGTEVGFATTEDLEVVDPDTTGEVPITALVAGAIGSGLSGAGTPLTSSDRVTGINVATVTTNGVDAETTAEYSSRLDDGLAILSPMPLVAGDLERFLQKYPTLGRVLVIDKYKPASGVDSVPAASGAVDTNRALSTTIALALEDGEPVGSLRATILADLIAVRGQNYEHYLINPTYNPIDVEAEIEALPGFDPDEVAAASQAALIYQLGPGQYGRPQSGDGTTGRFTSWVDDDTVAEDDLYYILRGVEGVKSVTALSFAAAGDTLASTPVVLDGPAPLTRPGDITVTAA